MNKLVALKSELSITMDKNIIDALKNQRPHDKVIKILSNKFAIVQGGLLGGGFETNVKICGLDNGTIYFYGTLNNIKNYYINHIESIQNIYHTTAYNYKNGIIYKTKSL